MSFGLWEQRALEICMFEQVQCSCLCWSLTSFLGASLRFVGSKKVASHQLGIHRNEEGAAPLPLHKNVRDCREEMKVEAKPGLFSFLLKPVVFLVAENRSIRNIEEKIW